MHNMMTMIDNDGLQRRRLLNEKVRKFIKPNSITRTKISDLNEPYPDLNVTLIALS